MKKLTKLSTSFSAAAVSMAFVSSVAFAANSTDVVNTGDHVNVNGGSSSQTNVNVANSNNAVISQSSYTSSNTGDNTANRNIGAVSVQTGDASVANAFTAKANSNATSISGLGGQSNDSTSLTNTGDHVNLNGNGGDRTNVNVANSNNAYVNQSSVSDVNTGDNTANRNIGATGISTGAANVANLFNTQVNSNQTAISGVGAGNGGADVLGVTNTGDNVTVGCQNLSFLLLLNDSNCGDQTNVNVSNRNNAVVSQSSVSSVNTGDNTANRNIGLNGADASIMTGAANVGNVFSVLANSNVTGISGNGLLDGSSNESSFTNTGDHFTVNGAGTQVVTHVNVSNSNNAVAHQDSFNESNTGDNTANRNIDTEGMGAMIGSGNAAMTQAFLAGANWNWTAIGGNAGMPSPWWMF